MMHAERMSELSLIVPKSYSQLVIDKLHELQVYHIIDHQKSESDKVDIGSPFADAEKISESLIKVRSLISHLQIHPKEINAKSEDVVKIKEKIDVLAKKFTMLQEKNKENESVLNKEREMLKLIAIAAKLSLSLEVTNNKSEILKTFIGFTTKSIADEVKLVTNKYELKEEAHEKRNMFALFVERKYEEAIKKILEKAGYEEMRFETLEGLKGDAKKVLHKSEETIKSLEKVQQEIEKEKEAFTLQHQELLLKAEAVLHAALEKAQAPLRFGVTEKAMMIKGWIPTRKLKKVEDALMTLTQNKVYFQARPAKDKENVPIELKNNRVWKPFEFFLEIFALPTYNEIDPTFLMFITFPIFFGIMLGDVGYGLVTLLLFLFLKKKMPSLKQLLNIMILASVITICFGFIYGEFFGFEHVSDETGKALCEKTGLCLPRVMEVHSATQGEAKYIYDFPRLLSRVHSHMNVFGMELLSVLVIGALLGIVHINFALGIGIYNTWRAHGLKHAILEKASWIVLEIGAVVMILGFMQVGFQPWVGACLMLLSVVMLYKGEGIKGLIELPSIISNILSYMRLGAVGLASVGLAVVINENLTMPFIEKGGIFIVLGILIFVVGHVINIALGIIGPFLHSLRLHYVEFFGKFYYGGGFPYVPFGKKV